jgi:hypothetical protein
MSGDDYPYDGERRAAVLVREAGQFAAATRAPYGIDDIITENRRREATEPAGRRRSVALAVLVAVLLAGAVILPLALRATAGHATRLPGAARRSSSPFAGSGMALLVWPGSQCCRSGNTAYVDNLSSGLVTERRLPPMGGGDFPYLLERLDRWLVFNGESSDPGVLAISEGLTTRPRVLGNATWFVPAASAGEVLLVYGAAGEHSAIQPVSVSNGAFGRRVTVPTGALVIEGTTEGIALVTASDELELWRPHAVPRRITHLAQGAQDLVAASAGRIAYDSGCTPREATAGSLAAAPVGYLSCTSLHVLDVATGVIGSYQAPRGSLGWEPSGFIGITKSQFAPGAPDVAASAAVGSLHEGGTRVFIVDLRTRSVTEVPSSNAVLGSVTEWSETGAWLFYQGADGGIWAYETADRRSVRLAVPKGAGVFGLVVLSDASAPR